MHKRLDDVIMTEGEERLPPEMMRASHIEVAMRRHKAMLPEIRKDYAGFYCKQHEPSDERVEMHFVFGRAKFTPCEGYVSFQALRTWCKHLRRCTRAHARMSCCHWQRSRVLACTCMLHMLDVHHSAPC